MKKSIKGLAAVVFAAQSLNGTPIAVLAAETSQSSTPEVSSTSELSGSESELVPTVPSSEEQVPNTEDTTTGSDETPGASSETDTSESSSGEDTTDPSTEPTTPEVESPSKPEPPQAETPQTEKPKAPTPAVKPPRPEVPKKPGTSWSSGGGAAVGNHSGKSTEGQRTLQEQDTSSSDTSSEKQASIHFEKDESVESFIRKIAESARKLGQEHDLYASVMIAQAVLESGAGQSTLAQAPHYNLFGIKGAYQGKTVLMATKEDNGTGQLYTIQAGFRVYGNYEESLLDYVTLLKDGLSGNPTFYQGAWKAFARNYQEATNFLMGRYATDTQYAQKLNGLIETYDLTAYDQAIQGAVINQEGYYVPVRNYQISSRYGWRDSGFHRGIDLAANQGEPIYATKAGKVIKAEYHDSWGNYVVVEHEDGVTTLYAHQQQYVVQAGQAVEQGQILGYVGSTGNSTGPHLHLELCRDQSLSQAQLMNPEVVLILE